jgi:hypothetical protein
VVPLPPWCPGLAPIEEMISKVKNAMQSTAARATGVVYAAFALALQDVTLDDVAGGSVTAKGTLCNGEPM